MLTFSETSYKKARFYGDLRRGARVRHPYIALASRKQGIAPTTDRHRGLSDKSWPDRAINYDGNLFVLSIIP